MSAMIADGARLLFPKANLRANRFTIHTANNFLLDSNSSNIFTFRGRTIVRHLEHATVSKQIEYSTFLQQTFCYLSIVDMPKRKHTLHLALLVIWYRPTSWDWVPNELRRDFVRQGRNSAFLNVRCFNRWASTYTNGNVIRSKSVETNWREKTFAAAPIFAHFDSRTPALLGLNETSQIPFNLVVAVSQAQDQSSCPRLYRTNKNKNPFLHKRPTVRCDIALIKEKSVPVAQALAFCNYLSGPSVCFQ